MRILSSWNCALIPLSHLKSAVLTTQSITTVSLKTHTTNLPHQTTRKMTLKVEDPSGKRTESDKQKKASERTQKKTRYIMR